jgi:hypothetical protein
MLKNPGVFGAWGVSEMLRFDEFREANERYAPCFGSGDLLILPGRGDDVYGREAVSGYYVASGSRPHLPRSRNSM